MDNVETADNILRLVSSCDRNGLLTDIDGTISRIAGHPAEAVVEERAKGELARLSDRFTLIGAVSGRGAIDARNLVGLDSLVYSGNHGMEIWRDGQLEQSPLAARYAPQISRLLNNLQITKSVSGFYVEDKGLTASVHFRGVENPAEVEDALLDEIHHLAHELGLRVTRGQMVFEIRPPVELSKGTSVVELINEYHLDGLVYLGDDITDVDAFLALSALRSEHGGHFYSIGVRSDATPDPVEDSADAMVDGVDGVIDLLCSI